MAVWWKKIKQIFIIPDLRKKILITLSLMVVFRAMAHIPIPLLDAEKLQNFFNQNQIFGLLDVFSGGGLSNLSIVMLGVGPYITSSIIFQLLTMVIPQLEKLAKEEGEDGRRKMNQYTRWASIPLAAIQGYGTISLFNRTSQIIDGNLSIFQWILILITITAGTVFLMWIGELISEKGIGNGISLVIFAGIIAGLPNLIRQTFLLYDSSMLINIAIYGILAVGVIAGVVFITEGQRNIPVSYARRVQGNRALGGRGTFLPLRINQAGVMPIIFALSVMLFPGVIANFFSTVDNVAIANFANSLDTVFSNKLFYGSLYFIFTIIFTYFYTSVTFNPKDIAENLQKSGGFIPGIRPGENTVKYLKTILYRVTLVGSIFLGFIAVLPFITEVVTNTQNLVIGGTSLLIVVSVILEVIKQAESQMVMRDYESL